MLFNVADITQGSLAFVVDVLKASLGLLGRLGGLKTQTSFLRLLLDVVARLTDMVLLCGHRLLDGVLFVLALGNELQLAAFFKFKETKETVDDGECPIDGGLVHGGSVALFHVVVGACVSYSSLVVLLFVL